MNTLSLVEVIEHDHFYTHDNNEERERNGNGQFKGETRKPSPHEDVGHDHSYSSLPTSSSTSDDCEMCIDENIDENPDENIDENDSESDKCDDEDPCTYSTHHSVQGRHIVELDVLAEGLEKGCSSCGQPLQLTSYIGESRYGLGSLLHLRCSCKKINYVPTGKRHSKNIWDVNSKLGAAMIFCGIGESVVNNLLAALNLPNISPTTLKRREREAGSAFEAFATETCSDAIAAESRSCQSEEDQAVSFDSGWQTRGSGRNYASLSGHGSMIGVNTGKVLSYAVRCKKCRFCDRAVDKENPKEHDCRKNWEKSSKAMESDMAVEMLHELKSKGFHVKKLIMDNDTTTISRARASFDESLEKFSDFNHTKKNVTNKLYSLRKEKRYNNLGPKAINHLTKCFAYAVKGSEDAASMKKNLEAIPCHVFGDHSRCSEWCGYLKNPSSYKPTSLPYGKYMTGEDLLSDLKTIFEEYAANSEKLVKVGSTQTNESFNHTVASKNPKSNFYSASESTSFRVAAAVAQKNIGLQTLTKVYENLLLSPGKHTNSYISKASRKRDYQKIVKSSVECKKRRKELKSAANKQVSTSEVKEGTTYQSAIDLAGNLEPDHLQEIPDRTLPPASSSVSNNENTFLFFDLETTGLGTSSEIVQLACVSGDDIFNRYVLPSCAITPSATAVTGLHVVGGELFCHKEKVESVGIDTCLKDFKMWLSKFHRPVLVCHNGKVFDSVILMKTLSNHPACGSLPIDGFVDTLHVFREVLPKRDTYRLEKLVLDTMSVAYNAHSAVEDVKILQSLVKHHRLSCEILLKHSFSVDFILSSIEYKSKTTECLNSLQPLVTCLSSYMIKKIAQSGLAYCHLKLAFDRGGAEGLENILSEKQSDGNIRVTRNKSILSKVITHFST